MGNSNNEDQQEFHRWRGGIDVLVKNHSEQLEAHNRRLDGLDDKVRDVLNKLAVPLFLTSIVGVGLGGLIVALLTRQLK